MEINKILRADYLDIIFDGRNKAYGGYELRRKYAKRSMRATAWVIVAAAIGFAAPVIAAGLKPKAAAPMNIVDRPVILPVLPNPEVTPPPPPPPGTPRYDPPPTFALADPRITPDQDVTEVLPTQDDLDTANVGLVTAAGTGDLNNETGLGIPGGHRGEKDIEVATATRPAAEKWVEQMPQFSGDINDWLGAHLRYPETAREQGLEGRSIIEFIVNEDGSIEAANVARGSAASLDAEALRVVRSMPKWKPGRQNGKAVRVYFTLPVTFHLD